MNIGHTAVVHIHRDSSIPSWNNTSSFVFNLRTNRREADAMWKHLSRTQLVAAWCAATIVIGACSVVAGATMSLGNGTVLLVAGLGPIVLMLCVWRRAPVITVAALVDFVNRPSRED